eukprot:5355637-Alexandrium_andersonii.AAC.1
MPNTARMPARVGRRDCGRMANPQLGTHLRARGGDATKTQRGCSPRHSQSAALEATLGASL